MLKEISELYFKNKIIQNKGEMELWYKNYIEPDVPHWEHGWELVKENLTEKEIEQFIAVEKLKE
ncbi:MAG: hypothetical protein HC917_10600 [Richelia sp. SM2_1_7]|nr:hypothetical protein [Richelia sp. SM2_1_7]